MIAFLIFALFTPILVSVLNGSHLESLMSCSVLFFQDFSLGLVRIWFSRLFFVLFNLSSIPFFVFLSGMLDVKASQFDVEGFSRC